jgi:hypothetical protein
MKFYLNISIHLRHIYHGLTVAEYTPSAGLNHIHK